MRKLRVIGASVLALCLAACGGGDEAAPPAETAAAPPSTSSAAQAPAGAPVVLAGFTGDVERGRKLYAQCKSCHALEPAVNKVGPTLHGVIGRKAGVVPEFRYSKANQASDLVWSDEVLFAYLEDPREYLPGTYMSYAGMKQPQQRADIIAFLHTAS